MECRFIFRKLGDARPGAFRGGPHETKDLLELVFVGGAWEERTSRIHFCHDAAGGPHVDAGIISAAAEKDVRCTVPEGDDFVGEGVDRDAIGASKAEITQLQLTFVVDEKVLRFQVAV